jgi:tRNA threonylcarbamoyladenosine modification (KEOPS) complex Cgi121 subunit
LKEGGNLIIVIYSHTIVTPLYCKSNLRKILKEKNMRTKNKILAIAGIEPPISSM